MISFYVFIALLTLQCVSFQDFWWLVVHNRPFLYWFIVNQPSCLFLYGTNLFVLLLALIWLLLEIFYV